MEQMIVKLKASKFYMAALAVLSYVPMALILFNVVSGAPGYALMFVSWGANLLIPLIFGTKGGFDPLFAVVSFIVILIELFISMAAGIAHFDNFFTGVLLNPWVIINAGLALVGSLIGMASFKLKRRK